jgi:hypothetical protein
MTQYADMTPTQAALAQRAARCGLLVSDAPGWKDGPRFPAIAIHDRTGAIAFTLIAAPAGVRQQRRHLFCYEHHYTGGTARRFETKRATVEAWLATEEAK